MDFLTHESELNMDRSLQCLYFYSTFDPFHKKMLTMVVEFEGRWKNSVPLFFAIDADQLESQCKRFRVLSVPTLIVLQKGKQIQRVSGYLHTSEFNAILCDIYSSNP